VAAVVALVQRNVRAALFLVVSIGLCESVTSVAKGLAHRPRPATALATAPSSSFPSGHAVAVMVGVLALLTVFVPLLGERGRMAATLVGAAVVVAIGFGRVALNVHHPSDVLAGWALGYVFYCLCLLLLNPSRSRLEQRRPDRV
jgi:undecaprenyl-diphosphatase